MRVNAFDHGRNILTRHWLGYSQSRHDVDHLAVTDRRHDFLEISTDRSAHTAASVDHRGD